MFKFSPTNTTIMFNEENILYFFGFKLKLIETN